MQCLKNPVLNISRLDFLRCLITDTKIYVSVVTHDNATLLEQLKSGFKATINWSKYQSRPTIQARNQFLDYLIDQSFQRVNRLFGFII